MNLHSVSILNYRSIKEQTITFDPSCRVLVGINECGKTNILKALSLLSPQIAPSAEDVREALPGESQVKESFVRFIFSLDEEEIEEICAALDPKIISKDKSLSVLTYKRENYDLRGFCRKRNQGLHRVNIKSAQKDFAYWVLPEGYTVPSRWKKVSPSAPAGATVNLTPSIPSPASTVLAALVPSTPIPLSNILLFDTEEYSATLPEHFTEVTPDDINKAVGAEIMKIVKKKLPGCIFWTYKDSNLLPPKVPLAAFAANPDSCIPLKHMFLLDGVTDIEATIAEAQKTATGLRNLLKNVARRATKHIHEIWKEYEDVEIQLDPYGPDVIDASVKDRHNLYEMSRRSDGFKRFISFLLIISAQVRTKHLENTLMLIDEPEMGLHPKGARYLRDELIEISGGNFVVYSTHSIFMIDNENIQRHLIVEKENEITTLRKADESNFVDEEVLYKALGYSVFETLKKINLLFEGWRDKKLFDVALRRVPSDHQDLKTKFKEIGRCHAHGAKDFKNISPLLELADRGCFILSDDDQVSREKQKEYIEKHGYGTWMRYSEVMPGTKAITGEDFVAVDAFQDAYKTIKKNRPGLPELSQQDLVHGNGRLYALKVWLEKAGVTGDDLKAIIETFKDEVFRNLKYTQVEKEYYDLLEKLADKLSK